LCDICNLDFGVIAVLSPKEICEMVVYSIVGRIILFCRCNVNYMSPQ